MPLKTIVILSPTPNVRALRKIRILGGSIDISPYGTIPVLKVMLSSLALLGLAKSLRV